MLLRAVTVSGSPKFMRITCVESEGTISNKIVSRVNIDDSWKRIIGIAGSFFWYETIINGHGRDI